MSHSNIGSAISVVLDDCDGIRDYRSNPGPRGVRIFRRRQSYYLHVLWQNIHFDQEKFAIPHQLRSNVAWHSHRTDACCVNWDVDELTDVIDDDNQVMEDCARDRPFSIQVTSGGPVGSWTGPPDAPSPKFHWQRQ